METFSTAAEEAANAAKDGEHTLLHPSPLDSVNSSELCCICIMYAGWSCRYSLDQKPNLATDDRRFGRSTPTNPTAPPRDWGDFGGKCAIGLVVGVQWGSRGGIGVLF